MLQQDLLMSATYAIGNANIRLPCKPKFLNALPDPFPSQCSAESFPNPTPLAMPGDAFPFILSRHLQYVQHAPVRTTSTLE